MWRCCFSFLLLFAASCAPTPVLQEDVPQGQLIALGEIFTDGAGRCFARQSAPTETEIVTELVEVVPAVKDDNGVVTSPAVFRNVTRPVTREVASGAMFEAVCPQVFTTPFVSTLQRAMIVRRVYSGEVTGTLDGPTRSAIAEFQGAAGIESDVLAMSVARELGLIAQTF